MSNIRTLWPGLIRALPAKGTWGNLGHNAFRGPALWQIDAALSKPVTLTERLHLEFRAECFNLLYRAQYGNSLADISAATTFGRITTVANTGPTGARRPRQFHFAARLHF